MPRGMMRHAASRRRDVSLRPSLTQLSFRGH